MLSAPIANIHNAGSAAAASSSAHTTRSKEGSFAGLVDAGMQQAHGLETRAQSAVIDLLRGSGVEVHDAMIATQQSELAFELALQVRNKAVAAYQQMMQMQF